MQKITMRTLLTGVAFLFVLTLVPVAAFAEDGSSSGTSGSRDGSDDQTATTQSAENETETETETSNSPTSLRDRLAGLKAKQLENKENRLSAAKQKVCENRKTKIEAIMQRSITRAGRQITLFDTIATRVEDFYARKGKTLSNYDELVASVNGAKAAAQANLETLKSQVALDCTGTDPKGQVEAFKTALHSVNQDLKTFRTAVKNLIVGVKSVQGTTSSEQEGGQQ